MKGYVQYIMLLIIFYSAATLILLGAYPDPEMNPVDTCNDHRVKSGASLDWGEAKEDYSFHITETDAAMLAREMASPTIKFVLKVLANGDFPIPDNTASFL
jgi:hypothetical protein